MHRRRNYRLRIQLADEDKHSQEIVRWFVWILMPAALMCPVDFAVEFVRPEDDVRPDPQTEDLNA